MVFCSIEGNTVLFEHFNSSSQCRVRNPVLQIRKAGLRAAKGLSKGHIAKYRVIYLETKTLTYHYAISFGHDLRVANIH